MMQSDSDDLTYAEAIAAATPRWQALGQQIAEAWQSIEPSLRAWLADAEALTAEQWMDEPEGAWTFYDYWKQWFVEYDMRNGKGEATQP